MTIKARFPTKDLEDNAAWGEILFGLWSEPHKVQLAGEEFVSIYTMSIGVYINGSIYNLCGENNCVRVASVTSRNSCHYGIKEHQLKKLI